MWPCWLNQQKTRKATESGLTKVKVSTTIRLEEETRTKKTCRIREDHTKATKEVVLQIEEEVVVERLTRVTFNVTIVRNMVSILVIVQRSERVKQVMQRTLSMKKNR